VCQKKVLTCVENYFGMKSVRGSGRSCRDDDDLCDCGTTGYGRDSSEWIP
jgi:hypothetical protein